MCTTCSECVTDVYVGVKTHLCNLHTLPCTSAQNTCSKVHVTLTAGCAHTRPSYTRTHACTCTWVRTRAQYTTRHAEAPPPGTPICAYAWHMHAHAHACACTRIRAHAHMHIHAHMHVCAYVYIHVHTHAHVDVRMHARKHAWNDSATTTG